MLKIHKNVRHVHIIHKAPHGIPAWTILGGFQALLHSKNLFQTHFSDYSWKKQKTAVAHLYSAVFTVKSNRTLPVPYQASMQNLPLIGERQLEGNFSATYISHSVATPSPSLAPTIQRSKLIQNLCYHVSEGQEYLSETSRKSKLKWNTYAAGCGVHSISSLVQELSSRRYSASVPTTLQPFMK